MDVGLGWIVTPEEKRNVVQPGAGIGGQIAQVELSGTTLALAVPGKGSGRVDAHSVREGDEVDSSARLKPVDLPYGIGNGLRLLSRTPAMVSETTISEVTVAWAESSS